MIGIKHGGVYRLWTWWRFTKMHKNLLLLAWVKLKDEKLTRVNFLPEYLRCIR